MEKYKKLLEEAGADAWEIIDTRTEGWEFYFIGHRLDQNRAKKVEHITLKAYKYSEDGTSMGSATARVAPDESPERLRTIAADLVFQASLVKNRPYRLNPPCPFEPVETQPGPLAGEAQCFIETLGQIPETETEYLNSYEIFTADVTRRLINSEGVDITERYPASTLDLVINAKDETHEIELYRLMEMGSCDPQKLTQSIRELLSFGRDRLRTVPTPAGIRVPVLLSTDAALSVYQYFLDQLNTASVVRGVSSFVIGKPVAEDRTGDAVTIEAKRILPGSPENFSCDPEGAPIRDLVLMKDHVPCHYVGGRRFSQYLGIDDTFQVSNWAVSGGTCSEEEIRSGAGLEIVEFSDFQVDGMTGDIFGEIRLAYYRDGKGNVTPVSGGSISGNMADNLADLGLSAQTRQYSSAVIPSVTRLNHITISGAEGGGK